jgi:capsular polysaccharide transport system permease protein
VGAFKDVASQIDLDRQSLVFGDTAKAISAELRKAARRARTPNPILSGGGGFRARKSDRYFTALIVSIFVSCFALPVICSTIYYSLIAADQYVTEARFAVRSGSDTSIAGLSVLSSFLDTGQARDGLIIADYVKSTALLDVLAKQVDLRKMFSNEHDLIARFDPEESAEDFIKYWQSQVDITVDRNSGLVTLKLRAFTPEDSLKLTQLIIAESERMVNQLTRKSMTDNLERTQQELDDKRERLQSMVSELRDARNAAGVLDVGMAAKAYMELLTNLRMELSKQELTIKVTAANAPQLPPLVKRADVLRAQIAGYEREMAGEFNPSRDKKSNLAEDATKIEQKEIELSIAKDEYADAMAGYQSARLAMEKQRSYLLTYVNPRLAEEAIYPRRFWMSLTFLIVSALLSAVLIGVAFMVRDHMAK